MSENHKKFAKRNKEAYDAWSSFYDSYPNTTVFTDEFGFPSFWKHVRDKRVLEIGCGTGRHTTKLVAQKNTVTALDLSSKMLAAAKSKSELNSVNFIEADFLEYHFQSDTFFEVVLGALVLEHIEDLRLFFEKVNAILAPGGEAFFSEIHPQRALAGTLAHFKKPDGSGEVHLASVAHTIEQFENAIRSSGLSLKSRSDILGPNALAKASPTWIDRVGRPLVQVWHLAKSV